MLRKLALAASAAAFATAATADNPTEHTIVIFDGGYFPQIAYVDPGDRLIFVNESDAEHSIISRQRNNGGNWELGPIAAGQEAELIMTTDKERYFFKVGSEDENGEFTVSGIISFDEPPLDNN